MRLTLLLLLPHLFQFSDLVYLCQKSTTGGRCRFIVWLQVTAAINWSEALQPATPLLQIDGLARPTHTMVHGTKLIMAHSESE